VPLRAGDTFNVAVSALSKNNNVTVSFDKPILPPNATATKISLNCVRPNGAREGQLTTKAFEFDKGKATAAVSWNEVGSLQLTATTENAFLDTGLMTAGSTQGAEGTDACASVGPVIPKYFLVEQFNEPRKPLDFFYAGEPIPIKVTAMNAAGQATENYSAGILSQNVTLSAYDKNGKSANPNGGVLGAAAIEAGAFAKGMARANPTYSSPADANGKRLPLAPGVMRLRAQNADNTVGSSGDDSHEKAMPEIRSGRLRIATLFGRAGSTLKLPITAEYWSGKSWIFNDKDDFTIVPAASIAQTSHAHANGSGAKPKAQVFSDLSLKGGETELPVQADVAGWIDIAFNLGANTAQDQSCLKADPTRTSTAANLPWLQSLSGCTDPSGRATFGIFAPESRRIIHVREVFN
jgi:MSHA biogenesis protein MshQ